MVATTHLQPYHEIRPAAPHRGGLLFTFSSPAQKAPKPYAVELTFTQVSDIPDRRFFIDSIADARAATATIGEVVRGMGRQVPAVLKGGLLPALQNYLYCTYITSTGVSSPTS